MNLKIFLLLLIFIPQVVLAQEGMGIGTTSPHSSAALDISSNNKGFLVPRLSQSARLAIASPTNGLLVYDSTSHRLYQFQEGEWRYMLTNASWAQSTTRNYTYSSSNNVGLGITLPTEKLDVNGQVRSRSDVIADGNIVAGGDIIAAGFTSTGNASVGLDASADGSITSYNSLNLNSATATVQLQNLNSKKAFFQLDDNNFRFGTNSGNTTGKIVFRLNNKDAMIIDKQANISLLGGSGEGRLTIGWKLCRFAAPEINMLPVISGVMPMNGGDAGWISPFFAQGSWERTGVGKYEISCTLGITPNCSIIVSSTTESRICMAKYIRPGTFGVETYTRAGIPVNCDFTYMVNDPLL